MKTVNIGAQCIRRSASSFFARSSELASGVWTAKALSGPGLDLWPATKLTAGSVMRYLEAHPRECRLKGN
ncbi:MAG TPA: hypothetical protein VFV71_09925 [Burkholderiales bacterium]|nr:hypothetical protein [Burkholderiales bacterium]